MWGDARERGLPFWPYAVLGLFLGSVGPLAYLIHRERCSPCALGSVGPLAYLIHRELRTRAPQRVAA